MFRKLIYSILISAVCTSGLAQNSTIDSLKSILINTNKPVERFDILNKLTLELTGWKGDNVDSSYCVQMLHVAQELKNDSLLAISYNWLGSYFYLNNGDNSTSLEYFFKALPFAEKENDKRRISSLYFDIALVYFDLQNNEKAVENTRMGGKNLPDKIHPLYDFMLIQYQGNMAQYFLLKNQPDSALYYTEGLAQTNKRMNGGPSYDFNEYTLLGSAYAQINNTAMADENFKKALELSDVVENTSTRVLFYISYIPFLLSNNRIDEASIQAKHLLEFGTMHKNNNLKLAAAGLLRRVFVAKDQIDSAYFYSQMEANINTQIFSHINLNRIQALAFNEQLRIVEEKAKEADYQNQLKLYGLLTGLGVFFIIAFILYRNNRQKHKANQILESTLSNLKATQSQLIQSEKMASLGELTAGIAHEIQNPLNFVNNFSEVSNELIDEMKEELKKGDVDEGLIIADDIKQNLQKINHHGQRASGIVKGMLEHSRTSDGKRELTDINALADEYLRLAYHGLRAKDKSFNADFKMEFDEKLPKVNVVPQDIGRVLLNLINNAFYAVDKKAARHPDPEYSEGEGSEAADNKSSKNNYQPEVVVSTRKLSNSIEINVKDNGDGIPSEIKDKIFQPFFTTKPTGSGTGLGLSLSYDIVKAHGGELKVKSLPDGEVGSEFLIEIPIKPN